MYENFFKSSVDHFTGRIHNAVAHFILSTWVPKHTQWKNKDISFDTYVDISTVDQEVNLVTRIQHKRKDLPLLPSLVIQIDPKYMDFNSEAGFPTVNDRLVKDGPAAQLPNRQLVMHDCIHDLVVNLEPVVVKCIREEIKFQGHFLINRFDILREDGNIRIQLRFIDPVKKVLFLAISFILIKDSYSFLTPELEAQMQSLGSQSMVEIPKSSDILQHSPLE